MGPVDEISQAERSQVLENDRKVRASTYLSQAQASADEDRGGRFAAAGSSPRVIGAAPISYPQQPPNSPWHHDPVPMEEPLGFSVEDHVAVGEPHEITQASAVPVMPDRVDTVEDEGPAAAALSHVVTVAAGSRPKWRRRL